MANEKQVVKNVKLPSSRHILVERLSQKYLFLMDNYLIIISEITTHDTLTFRYKDDLNFLISKQYSIIMDVDIRFSESAFKHSVTMPDLTEEEYDALGEYYTKNPPKIDPTKRGTGFFTRRTLKARTITVDNLAANYLITKVIADHKTPADIISEMVLERIAATM
jgi:hypothetical protein